jgi:hypothetical protein
MVQKFTKDGHPYREPPYTPEEEADLYERMSRPPVAIAWGSRRAQKAPDISAVPAAADAKPEQRRPDPPQDD